MDDHISFNKEIIRILTEYVEKNPSQRFGQLLFNLDINQFRDKNCPSNKDFLCRDIHADSSEDILKRVKERIEQLKG